MITFLYQDNEEPKKETTTSTKSTEKDPESDESPESDVGMYLYSSHHNNDETVHFNYFPMLFFRDR